MRCSEACPASRSRSRWISEQAVKDRVSAILALFGVRNRLERVLHPRQPPVVRAPPYRAPMSRSDAGDEILCAWPFRDTWRNIVHG